MTESQHDASPDVQELVQGTNRFALGLYSQLASETDGNVFVSPSSIALACAMTSAGAAGETLAEMRDACRFSLPPDVLHPAFQTLQRDTRTEGVELRIANRLWGHRGYSFLPQFLRTTQEYYQARLAEADFATEAEAARVEINEWVAEQTAQRIKDLIEPPLAADTRLVLVNAIYFLGTWFEAFDPAATCDREFRVGDQSRLTPTMRQTEYFLFGEFDDLQVLEMVYNGARRELPEDGPDIGEVWDRPNRASDFVMTILLPRKRDGVGSLEGQLTVPNLQKWTTLRSAHVDVSLPRFRIESSYRLNDALQALGIRKAFVPNEADFSGMSDDPDGLFIGEAIHKAFVEVNEEGTEAAAATAMMVRAAGAPPPPVMFTADHPFVFLIRDRRTGLIHFIGRLAQPAVPG